MISTQKPLIKLHGHHYEKRILRKDTTDTYAIGHYIIDELRIITMTIKSKINSNVNAVIELDNQIISINPFNTSKFKNQRTMIAELGNRRINCKLFKNGTLVLLVLNHLKMV